MPDHASPLGRRGRPRRCAPRRRRERAGRRAARSGTLWIDPIAQRWFTGSWTEHTGDGATMINYAAGQPGNLGYRHIATPLEANLRSLGVN